VQWVDPGDSLTQEGTEGAPVEISWRKMRGVVVMQAAAAQRSNLGAGAEAKFF